MKKLLLITISIFLCFLCKAETEPDTSYAGGSGTSADPYQIATLAQLRLLSETPDDWSKSFILTASIDARDTKSWNDSAGFSRIGTEDSTFTGTFNGNNYTIDSLYISNASDYYGMFGTISGSVIKNLGLVNCNITPGGNYSGTLVGVANNSSIIEKCYVTGNVSSKKNVTGGLAGYLISSTMRYCYANITIYGTMNCGGLVGIAHSSSKIHNCFVAGNISGGKFFGGISAQVEGSGTVVANCYMSGSISNTSYAITSINSGSISNCYFDQTINEGTATSATALKSIDFSDEANFPDWNFDAIWYMDSLPEIDSVKRPYLRCQYSHYTLSFTANSNGTISGQSIQFLFADDVASAVTAVPDTGYYFSEWQDATGASISKDNTLAIENVFCDSTIYAVFKENRYAGGSGTSSDPFQIATLDQLRVLSESPDVWSRSFILTASIDARDTKSWNSGAGFSRIGTEDTTFTGTFNGNNYTIDSLYISNTNDYYGMFGTISGAEIKNLGLVNCNITPGGNYSGTLVGSANNYSIIEKCYVTGNVSSKRNVTGGLVGYLISSTMRYCYANITIYGTMNCGGLVGIVSGSSTIYDCFVAGDISGGSYYGGITGQLKSGTITNCYISASIPNTSYVISKVNAGSISNCYYDQTINEGSVTQAKALESVDFYDEANFEDWDFETIWSISIQTEIDYYPRPYLRCQRYLLSFSTADSCGTVSGGLTHYVSAGDDHQVTAIPNQGYNFIKWQNTAGDSITNENPISFTNVSSDSALVAVFEVDETSSVKSLNDNNELFVYPNPSIGLINISIEEGTENAKLSVYSISGQQVYNISSFNGGTVDLSELKEGIYMVEIRSERNILVARIVISK